VAWSQEEFERRNPRSEALRAAQAAKFLEQFRETARSIEEQKQPRQLSLNEINTAELLDSLRRTNDPKNLSIDQMKALGLYVPEYRSTSLSNRPLQRELPVQSNTQQIESNYIRDQIEYLKKDALQAGIPYEKILYDGTVENYLKNLSINNPKGIVNTLKQEEFNRPADIPSVKRAIQQIESTPIPRSVGGNKMAMRLGKLLIPLITGTSAGVLLDDVIAANQAERMPAPIDEDEAAKLAAAELLAQAVS
jgi:hypothetical protein